MNGTSLLQTRPIRYPDFPLLFVGWTVLALLAFLRFALLSGESGRVFPELIAWLTCYYPWLLLTPLVFRLERKFPLGRRLRNFLWMAMIGVGLTYVAAQATTLVDLAIAPLFRGSFSASMIRWSVPLRTFGEGQALYWFTAGVGCLIRNLITLREKERLAARLSLEKLELENSLHRAELDTLRARLNPHFLFNCLQGISTLSQRDPKMAGQMLTRLGDLLRVAVKRNAEPESTLKEEIALVETYLSIEMMRFRDRLKVIFDVAEETETALVPTFLLQPLVENAITHGLRNEQKAGLISIASSLEAETLVLHVADNGTGISNEQLAELEVGIGLGSTCERLARMYPDRHTFSIHRLPEGGTEIRISLPLKRRRAPEEGSREHASTIDRG
jgi:two-component system, LytTR family, sensor kinase